MNEFNGYDIEGLSVDMTATIARTITEADIALFAGVPGDNDAVHINEEFDAPSSFAGRIAHGFLTASVIPAVTANKFPEPGTLLPPREEVRVCDTVVIDNEVLVTVTSGKGRSY
ncbi:MaoC/PaaZ C-terminal domain-containing protein [Paraburkholderia sp. RL17-373-BIF-A]|jgi:3-hydroxybutyryl-CoA dehydratase|uniref:MaoC/PaaZ C-terminal domain-containing protein n=1 Tax=Paraburkholderia sp. RL17-373-BIF-A TaxID=3031629 RepID=UPI0038B9F228